VLQSLIDPYQRSIHSLSLEVKEKMKRSYYYLAFVLFSLVAAGVTFSFFPSEPTSALDAPLSEGYETALAQKSVRPIFRPKGSAPAVWGPGDLYRMVITGEESNNALFQFEATVPKGGGPPPHSHSKEDETFYVVSGELEMLIGDKKYTAKAGDFVYIPRGTVHQFKNTGSGTAVQFVTFVGAGMEGFFKEVFPEAKDQNAEPPPVTEELIRRMNEAGPKYGIKFVQPPNAKKP
jgi:quercetin dioxygenase-like cupin family protein